MTAHAMFRRTADPEAVVAIPLLIGVAALAWAASWAMDQASYGVIVGSLIGALLAGASVILMRRLTRDEPDVRIVRLLMAAPLLKLGMSIVRYAVTFVLYDGSADAAVYHNEGVRLRELYAQGILDADLGRAFVGTGVIRMFTGLLYTVTGPSLLGAFFIFSWIGFWGLYAFYRAFCIAVPDGDRYRYALLVLLLPSLLFWPSSLGKEALMTLGLGLLALGSARLLTHRRHGFPIAAVGIMISGCVRPHVAAMAVLGLVAAYFTRRQPAGASIIAPIGKLVGICLLTVGLAVAVGQAKALLGIDAFNTDAIESARADAAERTNEAGSVIQRSNTDFDPSELHVATASVLFRPFPWEAKNLQSLIASIEGLTVLALLVVGWRRVAGGFRYVLRTPYVVQCVTYSLLFIYGFSSFANFGILTRQRVQVLPFILVLVALPPLRRRSGWRATIGAPDAVDA